MKSALESLKGCLLMAMATMMSIKCGHMSGPIITISKLTGWGFHKLINVIN